MINAIQIALSGLNAASQRASASASNIANQTTVGALDPADGAPPYAPVTVTQQTQPSGGVQASVIPSGKPAVPTYSPNSPFANQEGLIGVPDINLGEEIVNLQIAKFSYQASTKIIQTESDMQKSLLQMFDRKA